MRLTILGCGTSGGVPKIPEYWGACDPKNPKNRRRRASVLIEQGDTCLLVDTTPDLREQVLSAKVQHLDAVLYTHDHGDHTHGIDDLRGFYQKCRQRINVYGDQLTMKNLEQRFAYVFHAQNGYPAICEANIITQPFHVGDIKVIPFEQIHGNTKSLGFRFGDIAYSTDLNGLPKSAIKALEGVKVWVVDALRYDPHPTHSHLAQTLEWIDIIKPDRAIITHMTWDMDYATLLQDLPRGVEPAYDGMVISL